MLMSSPSADSLLLMSQKPKKFVALSCSHGQYINQEAASKALSFISDYRPDRIFHLGDFIDASAFRANGLANEGDTFKDLEWGLNWILELRPNILFMGNHEARLVRLISSKNETVSFAAHEAYKKILSISSMLKCELVDYTGTYDPDSWRLIGDTAIGHGYMYNENAARDHVEMIGRPVIFGHTHKMVRQAGRMHGAPEGVSVGCLCDIPAMNYAHGRRATSAWDHGLAFGEYTDKWCKVYLERLTQWQKPKIKQAT